MMFRRHFPIRKPKKTDCLVSTTADGSICHSKQKPTYMRGKFGLPE